MRAIPALDLRGGACVQLVGGSYAAEAVRLPDPPAVAASWSAAGFAELHIIDLDGATGAGSNDSLISEILRESRVECQVGGGVRSTGAVASLLERGARRVIVGTRALEDARWLAEIAAEFPGRIIVAADTRGREVVTHGWQLGSGRTVLDVVRSLDDLPLAGVLITAVHQEGRMAGPDLELVNGVTGATNLPVYASGGIGSLSDLESVAARGAAAAVLGMALYTGALDLSLTARRFTA